MTEEEIANVEAVLDIMDPPVPGYLRTMVLGALRGEPVAIIMPRRSGHRVALAAVDEMMRAVNLSAPHHL